MRASQFVRIIVPTAVLTDAQVRQLDEGLITRTEPLATLPFQLASTSTPSQLHQETEQVARIRQLAEQGKTRTQIAYLMGVEYQFVDKSARKFGIEVKSKKVILTDAVANRIFALAEDTRNSLLAIAFFADCSMETAKNVLNGIAGNSKFTMTDEQKLRGQIIRESRRELVLA